MRQRYYNPEIKRFINQDILTGSLSNSQSLNRYSYVQGNPVSYTDPFGLSPVNGLFSNSNNIHGALTLAGFTPGPGGAIADLLDTLLYLLEGDLGGAIGAGIVIFASGAGLAYKTVKAVGKADKVSDTAKLVKNTVNAFSESGSFMKAASNGADAAQTLKAVKQSRVVDKLKDAKTAIKNKFNSKNISKLDLDDQVQGVYKRGSGFNVPDSSRFPQTRLAVHDDLMNRGYKTTGTTDNGYVVYKHPNGNRVTIKPTGEVITTVRLPVDPTNVSPKAPKYNQRAYYDETIIPDELMTILQDILWVK